MARARAHVSTPPLAAVAWTIGAFLIAAAPHLLAMPAWLASAIVVVCCWRLLGVHRGWPLPPAWPRILLTLLAVALVGIAFGGLWGRRAATSLLCVMLAAKMLELRTLRDLRAVASVSFFLIAAQFLFDERLALLTYLLAGCLSAVAALVVIEQTESAPAGREPDRNHPARILSDAAVLLLLAVPVALVLFVTFPRLAQPLWGCPTTSWMPRPACPTRCRRAAFPACTLMILPPFGWNSRAHHPRTASCTGVARSCGTSTAIPGARPISPTECRRRWCPSALRRGATAFSSSHTNVTGCLPWTTRSTHRTVPARPSITRWSAATRSRP